MESLIRSKFAIQQILPVWKKIRSHSNAIYFGGPHRRFGDEALTLYIIIYLSCSLYFYNIQTPFGVLVHHTDA